MNAERIEKAKSQLAEYGYTLSDSFQIEKGEKAFSVVVSAKGPRFYVKQLSGAPLWSGPHLGDFVKSFWHAKKIERHEPNGHSMLKESDKRVVRAFVNEKPASSNLLETDGVRLDKIGLGGETVAMWIDGRIAIVSTESVKSDESIIRLITSAAGTGVVDFSYARKGHRVHEHGAMGRNGRGIYHETPAGKNDMVLHQDHRGAWRVDLVTSAGGNHVGVGLASGYTSPEVAFQVALDVQRARGIRGKSHVYIADRDGNLSDYEPMETNGRRKGGVTVDDLPVASSGGKVLACPSCGSEFSAMRGDYFMMPKHEALACQACGVPLVLRKRSPQRQPPAQEARHSPGNGAWDAAEEKGLVRIVVEEEQENYFDVYGEPDSAEEREEIIEQISRDGLNHFASQYRKRRSDPWETADSIGMVIGDLASSGYEESLKTAALDALRTPRKR